MDGAHLLDIPWQLDADHPAVMVYPRLVVDADKKRSADIERLYALGIDAYRVAREIAMGNDNFELDGVTGKLSVRFDRTGTHFERIADRAVYRDGAVVSSAVVP
jgi:outer membrane PBP1 activator LpoA protein